MDISNIVSQQPLGQLKMGVAMIKQNAKMEQGVADLVAKTADRGKNLDITV